ncbi:MAG: hypothetical protein KJ556_06545 [Gammaproteobacteria bacterium]|nr:hypothetical protein [Gammaproteobacteria bacterium]MBU2059006.1 hypothetical protein [Gammaproteobacteria bacterium]MBU2174769.1 hypothetical protein [Gammaproteobacteria bacterium]MBU2245784.1 hypothetical protein [Gammaproteobacteria bacterium]MBU2343564.1 hypothetical protein [Gammaproteobacteria bacterium]
MNKFFPYVLFAAICISTAACSESEPLQAVQPQEGAMDKKTQIQQEREQIRQLIGDAKASDPSQCRVLALGHKACGGPEAYVAYSTEQTDEAELLKLAEQYKNAQQTMQKQERMYSDCAIVPEPKVGWVNGYCVLGADNVL